MSTQHQQDTVFNAWKTHTITAEDFTGNVQQKYVDLIQWAWSVGRHQVTPLTCQSLLPISEEFPEFMKKYWEGAAGVCYLELYEKMTIYHIIYNTIHAMIQHPNHATPVGTILDENDWMQLVIMEFLINIPPFFKFYESFDLKQMNAHPVFRDWLIHYLNRSDMTFWYQRWFQIFWSMDHVTKPWDIYKMKKDVFVKEYNLFHCVVLYPNSIYQLKLDKNGEVQIVQVTKEQLAANESPFKFWAIPTSSFERELRIQSGQHEQVDDGEKKNRWKHVYTAPVQHWLDIQGRLTFDFVACDPTPYAEMYRRYHDAANVTIKELSRFFHPTFLNTFSGFTRGFSRDEVADFKNWNLIIPFILHLRFNWCANDSEFNYLLLWWATTIQRPWEKHGVALVVQGEQGIGKSSPIVAIMKGLGLFIF